MKQCIHANCNQEIKPEYELCFYHFKEYNGESDWTCSWCEEYKELNKMVDKEEGNLIYNER